jgi:hypothetical protein
MLTRSDSPDVTDTAVFAVVQDFFATRLHERSMQAPLAATHSAQTSGRVVSTCRPRLTYATG